MPPSLPTNTTGLPPDVPTATECWSECGAIGQVFFESSMFQQLKPKFQYGATVAQCDPASVVSNTSSRPAHTWSALAGSTARNWLYQAWTPTAYPLRSRAEPLLCRICGSAILFHGPDGLPVLETKMPARLVLPLILLGCWTSAYSRSPVLLNANVV